MLNAMVQSVLQIFLDFIETMVHVGRPVLLKVLYEGTLDSVRHIVRQFARQGSTQEQLVMSEWPKPQYVIILTLGSAT